MSHYHDSDDLKMVGEFKTLAPLEFGGFMALGKQVDRDDGAIPRKYPKLIAFTVACTTQCPYCLDAHRAERLERRARKPPSSPPHCVPAPP